MYFKRVISLGAGLFFSQHLLAQSPAITQAINDSENGSIIILQGEHFGNLNTQLASPYHVYIDAEEGIVNAQNISGSSAITSVHNRRGSVFNILHQHGGSDDVMSYTTATGIDKTSNTRYGLSVDVEEASPTHQYFVSSWVRLSEDFSHISSVSSNRANLVSFQPDVPAGESSLIGSVTVLTKANQNPAQLVVNTGNGRLSTAKGPLTDYLTPGQWHRLDAWLSVNDEATHFDDQSTFWVDGELVESLPQAGFTQTVFPTMQKLHFVNYMTNANSVDEPWSIQTDDHYVAFTQARVEISKEPTFSASSYKEIQPAISWSDNEVQFELNTNSFSPSDSLYLYVVKPDGSVNESGYPITFSIPRDASALYVLDIQANSGDKEINLSWTQTEMATSYNIYYSELPFTEEEMETGSLSCGHVERVGGVVDLHYPLKGLNNGQNYYFAVTAVNNGIEGKVSEILVGTPNELDDFSVSGLVQHGESITLTALGQTDFGAEGPILVFRSDLLNSNIDNPMNLSDYSGIGQVATNVRGAPTIEAVPEMPYGRAMVVGTVEDPDEIDGAGYRYAQLHVSHYDQPTTRTFEHSVAYWPEQHQQNAAPYLNSDSSWQIKPIWNMESSDGFGGNNINLFSTHLSYWNTSLLDHWGNHYIVSSNSIPVRYPSMPIDPNNNMTDYTGSPAMNSPHRELPLVVQTGYYLGSEAFADDGIAHFSITDVVRGPILNDSLHNLDATPDTNLARSQDWSGNFYIDKFNFPGYVFGWPIVKDAHAYVSDIYKTIGPGAWARVEICDNQDYALCKKKSPFTITSWRNNSITAEVYEGFFYQQNLSGLWLHVHNADWQHVGKIQLP